MQRLKIFLLTLIASFSLFTVVLPTTAQAAACSNDSASFLGLPTWYKYLTLKSEEGGGCSVELPQKDGQTDWGQSAGRVGLAIVEILLRIGAIVAVGYIIYGGYRYILSQGEPDNVKKAQGTILNAVIGLVITMMATALVSLIGGVLLR